MLCEVSNNSPSWGLINLFAWKLVPERWNGGVKYIQTFKDAWVLHNKPYIRAAAGRNSLPPEMLAGVCWIEVGGDPEFIDRVAFEVRAFDWSGPPFVDKHLTRIIGARYNRGSGLSLEQIRQNTSYGDFIVNHWQRFGRLMQ